MSEKDRRVTKKDAAILGLAFLGATGLLSGMFYLAGERIKRDREYCLAEQIIDSRGNEGPAYNPRTVTKQCEQFILRPRTGPVFPAPVL